MDTKQDAKQPDPPVHRDRAHRPPPGQCSMGHHRGLHRGTFSPSRHLIAGRTRRRIAETPLEEEAALPSVARTQSARLVGCGQVRSQRDRRSSYPRTVVDVRLVHTAVDVAVCRHIASIEGFSANRQASVVRDPGSGLRRRLCTSMQPYGQQSTHPEGAVPTTPTVLVVPGCSKYQRATGRNSR